MTTGGPQEQALRLNALCRKNSPQSVFFLSGTFGLEGWFVADFGDNFQYKQDPPNNKDVKTIAFPSLRTVFDQPWAAMKSRHFAVSTTYVKSRILRTFIDKYGRCPAPADAAATSTATSSSSAGSSHSGGGSSSSSSDDGALLAALAADMLAANGLADDAAFATSLALADLPRVAAADTIMVCSVLGSFLAQEVIKAVSLSGEPGFNVFVCSGFDCSVVVTPIAPKAP